LIMGSASLRPRQISNRARCPLAPSFQPISYPVPPDLLQPRPYSRGAAVSQPLIPFLLPNHPHPDQRLVNILSARGDHLALLGHSDLLPTKRSGQPHSPHPTRALKAHLQIINHQSTTPANHHCTPHTQTSQTPASPVPLKHQLDRKGA
jgi:hypothetical protein